MLLPDSLFELIKQQHGKNWPSVISGPLQIVLIVMIFEF